MKLTIREDTDFEIQEICQDVANYSDNFDDDALDIAIWNLVDTKYTVDELLTTIEQTLTECPDEILYDDIKFTYDYFYEKISNFCIKTYSTLNTVILEESEINVIRDFLQDMFNQINASIENWLQENDYNY